MAQPNSSFTEMLSTTIKKYGPEIYDNVTNNVTFYRYMKKRGRIDLEDGGESLTEQVAFDDNDAFQWYQGFQTLNLSRNDQFTTADFSWKQAAVPIQASGREVRQNMGESRKHNRVKELVLNAERTVLNQMGAAVYNTGAIANQLTGLGLYVEATTPASQTSVVGGIDRTNYAFWRNQALLAGGTATSSTNIQGRMNTTWLNCKRGTDIPQLILMGSTHYNAYLASLQTIQRITEADRGQAGYSSLAFAGAGGTAMVEYDDACAATKSYFLNLDFLKLRVHKDANFKTLEDRNPIDQDAFIRWMIFMGEMTIANCARQGVISG